MNNLTNLPASPSYASDFGEYKLEVKGYSYNLLDKSKHNIIRTDSLPPTIKLIIKATSCHTLQTICTTKREGKVTERALKEAGE